MPDLPPLPPVANEPLSLVLLAYNAAPHLAAVVQGWREALLARNLPFEIILVDDGSSDRTADAARELPEVKLLRHETPRGIGAALRTGLAETAHPLLACVPCDPAYRPQDLERFLAQIDKVHFMTGYRAGLPMPLALRALGLLLRGLSWIVFSGAPRRLPGWLGWRGHLSAWTARLFFGVRQRDVGCPFRVFRREVLQRSVLQSDSSFALIEQLAKANFAGKLFAEEEVALAVLPRPAFAGQPRQGVLREAYRVFSHPDFGPPAI
jgi:glycosyltransferase involved in cell wall biosynthesis